MDLMNAVSSSLVHRPSSTIACSMLRFYILQAFKSWRRGRPGNKASILCSNVKAPVAHGWLVERLTGIQDPGSSLAGSQCSFLQHQTVQIHNVSVVAPHSCFMSAHVCVLV